MVLEHFGKTMDAHVLHTQLPKHSWGNSLHEIGIFLQNQGMNTILHTNGERKATEESRQYITSGGEIVSTIITEPPGNIFIVGVGKENGKHIVAHYIVVERRGLRLKVFDPAMKEPFNISFPEILAMSRNPVQKNRFWLSIENRAESNTPSPL